jgi:hypothetical protein
LLGFFFILLQASFLRIALCILSEFGMSTARAALQPKECDYVLWENNKCKNIFPTDLRIGYR